MQRRCTVRPPTAAGQLILPTSEDRRRRGHKGQPTRLKVQAVHTTYRSTFRMSPYIPSLDSEDKQALRKKLPRLSLTCC